MNEETALLREVRAIAPRVFEDDELKYRYMLAQIPGATSSGPDAMSGTPPMRLGLQGSTMLVTNFIAGTSAFDGDTFANGAVLTELTGVLDYFNGNQLAPRTRQDIKP